MRHHRRTFDSLHLRAIVVLLVAVALADQAAAQIIDIQTAGPDQGVLGGVTFQTHNQKVIENHDGIFITPNGRKDEEYFRLQRSTDGGQTFTTVYEENYPVTMPTLETDEDNNLYLVWACMKPVDH